MSENKRSYYKQIRLNKKEKDMLERKFKSSGSESMSSFIRKMVLNGEVVCLDEKKLQEIYRCIISVANNINQIAARVNSTDHIYAEDIEELKKGIDTIWRQQRYFQSELMKLKP